MFRISKALSKVLRHSAVALGLAIKEDGFCRVADVLESKPLQAIGHCTVEDVKIIVQTSDKQRFSLEEIDDELWIRATQGHSLPGVRDELLLRPLSLDDGDLPKSCVHGTYRRHWPLIRVEGLRPGGRQGPDFRRHVHFAPRLPSEGHVVSGMRTDCEVAIFLDIAKALKQGLPLYLSENGVVLSPGLDGAVPPGLFQRVVDLKDGSQLWPVHPEQARKR